MNNFICEHCNNRMKEHIEDGGKSITFYCDCRLMVPLDDVIGVIDEISADYDKANMFERSEAASYISGFIKQKFGVSDDR